MTEGLKQVIRKENEGSPYIIFVDKGVLEVLLNTIGCEGLFLSHCAMANIEIDLEGKPSQLVHFWTTHKI